MNGVERQLHSQSTETKYRSAASDEEKKIPYAFQMPLHYPRYTKSDYEVMSESKLDRLLQEYGLPVMGDLSQKRKYAMGAFLWPEELR
eukprot:Gb_24388 [translate_table: standard]